MEYKFGIVDYLMFGGMLLVSTCTGVYYGCRSRYFKNARSQSLVEYLRGSKKLKPFPVAMSLIASYVSGVTILGTASEIYYFGSQYSFIAISILMSGCIIAFVYLPVFCTLDVHSSYEYLEIRFCREVQMLASVLFVIDEILFLPIVIYVPSLAFNQVTGINVHVIATIVSLLCIFYTTLGGLRAVVYADTWQIIVMFLSVIVVVCLGTSSVGGIQEVWNRCNEGGRIIFNNFNTSLYERQSVMAVLIGGTSFWTAFNTVHQTMVQRYLSLATERESKLSTLMFVLGAAGFVSLCIYAGLLVYATYHKCDPLSANRVTRGDQLLPLYVIEKVGHIKGIPGLFIAGVFGAALSSLAVILNSASTVILEDFIRGLMGVMMTEKRATDIVKVTIVTLGLISLGLVHVVQHLGGMLSVATSFAAIAAGTTFGMFTLGMAVPWSNSLGTFTGAVAGALLSGTVSLGMQYAIATEKVIPRQLPVNIERCFEDYGINATIKQMDYPDDSNVFPLFRLSFHWITPVGILTTLIVGTVVSFISGKTDLQTLDPEVISPVFQWILPKECHALRGTAHRRIRQRSQMYSDIELRQQLNS